MPLSFSVKASVNARNLSWQDTRCKFLDTPLRIPWSVSLLRTQYPTPGESQRSWCWNMWVALLHWHSPRIQISVRVKGLRKLPTGIQVLALSWTDQITVFSYLQFDLGSLSNFVSWVTLTGLLPHGGSHRSQVLPTIPSPGRQWHAEQYVTPDRPSKMNLWPADTQGLSVSKTAHYSLKNSLRIFLIVLFLEEIMARRNTWTPTSNAFKTSHSMIPHTKPKFHNYPLFP